MTTTRRGLAHKLGHSEYGGAPGLIQPAVAPDGGEGHTPTPSEEISALRRDSPA